MLGFDDFRFVARFYLGNRATQVRTVGVVAWRNQNIYRLRASQACALQLIEAFNDERNLDRSKKNSLDALFRLKTLANVDSNIEFDSFLNSENVLKPNSVSLKTQDDGTRAIVYPTIPGVSEEEFKKHFLSISDVQSVYELAPTSGIGRQRVLISDEIKEVLKTVKRRGFGISGAAREKFYQNPRSLFPEGEDQQQDLIDLAGFGPRVKGLGFPSFARPIIPLTKENWFDSEKSNGENRRPKISIDCEYLDGETKSVEFPTTEDAEKFLSSAREQLAQGNQSIEWENEIVPLSDAFVETMADQIISIKEPKSPQREKLEKKRLLIHTNEETIDYSEAQNEANAPFEFSLPRSFKSENPLLEHQVTGVGWLSGLLHRDISKGALLADDMGLGKTLQLLTFLAWCIEYELKEDLGKNSGPYNPILVVAPKILLDVWDREIDTYFDGGIFSPRVKLHGDILKSYRRAGSNGREVEPGVETLNIERLRENRLIITNFETVKNYQYTFAKVPWSVLVVDEAQEIKEPSTAITYALKVLNPMFRIASTGTPVETSLTNLWSIMDFAQPGNNLGSLKSFTKEYGEFAYDDPLMGAKLRGTLGFNTNTGLVLRRSKKEVLKDLPKKTIVEHTVSLDGELESKYVSVLKSVRESNNGKAAALKGLQQLAQLVEHPFLSDGEAFRSDHSEYLKSSTKLRKLVEILGDIPKSEKALVFTRNRRMQDMLKAVLDKEFGLNVGILNGATASKHRYVEKTREGVIDRFSNNPGFDVLILSPEVAGVGLTITAANHVVHYGRWWNPAKENQATDRVYRIKQKRPVCVHHIVLRHPQGSFKHLTRS